MTDGFRNRVATNVVAVTQRDPAAFRSGIGEGLERLGQVGSRIAAQDGQLQQQLADDRYRIDLIQRDRVRSATVADRMGAWPDVQVRTQNRLDDLKNSWKPTDGDYQAKADAIVTEELTGFQQSLGDDPEVTERFAPLMATFGASTRQAERRWGLQTRAKAEGQGVEKLGTALANGIVSDPTPTRLAEAMTSIKPLIDGLDAPVTVKDAVLAQQQGMLVRSFLDGRLAGGDWKGTRDTLNSGKLDGYIEPTQKAQYLRMADNAEQTAARQAELAEARRLSEARDGADTVEAKVKAGIVPTAAELRTARAGLAAAGAKPAELVAFDALSIRADTNRLYAGKDATTMRRDRDRLAAKVATGTATEAEQVMNAQLGDLVDAAEDREADALKGMLANGAAGRVAALGAINGDAATRYAIAEKLEPGLGILANVGPNARLAATQGKEVRAARPQDFGKAAEIDALVKAQLGPVIGHLGGGYADVRDRAWDIMANGVATRGGNGVDKVLLERAVGTMTGATLRSDGTWQGGVRRVRGRQVWLPKWQSAPEFEQQLMRTDFSGAAYAGGGKVDVADVVAHFTPDYFDDDAAGNPMYRLIDADGRYLPAKAGGAFVIVPRRGRR